MSIRNAKSCRNCSTIILAKGEPCPICKSAENLSPNWGGLCVIMNPQRSQIAKRINIHRAGLYAIRVRQ